MSQHLRTGWSIEQFAAWAGVQDLRYEYDGTAPVAVTGGTIGHSLVMRALHAALVRHLPPGPCRFPGPDAGITTIGKAVRYPDALLSFALLDPRALTVPDPVVVFEVISPTSQRTDRLLKVREYAAVPSIRRYVIVESTSVGLTILERATGDAPWQTSILIGTEDVVSIPEAGLAFPVAELYQGISFD